jgi:predicted membrane channel-forming protein YqfA (hemolysin III family)
MRTVIYLILGIIGIIVLIVISVLLKYLEVKTGIILTSLVLVIGVLVYFLLPKVPKRDYNHEGAVRAQQKEKRND